MNYRIEKDGLAVCIDDAGAQLTSVCWQDREYLWQGDPAYWSDQSLLLFPYVGRFTEGKYTLDQKEYPMDIHGFAKDSAFSVCASEEGRIVFGRSPSKRICPLRITIWSFPIRICRAGSVTRPHVS